MHLIDRVPRLDPDGGRYGIGTIEAEADIAGDEWFLVCHFVDDKVMPGTLMYQCCEQTLRIFLQRLGWVATDGEAAYQPMCGVEAVLKCRGPVTPNTGRVTYRVDLREIGYDPCPYAVADALMFADGEPIVMFSGLSVRIDGMTRASIEAFWENRRRPSAPLYTGGQILAFSVGRPSAAFGAPYRPFDKDRFIARLPGPPYLFLDRVVDAGPAPWRLEAGAWATAEYDIPPEAWYFRADRGGGVLPFCVLLEIALQACGFLAAYGGSALQSDQPLKFRNLDGRGTLHRVADRNGGRLTATARLTRVSRAGAMIIECFRMEVGDRQGPIYTGESTFGFFSDQALANQVGLREAGGLIPSPAEADLAGAQWEQIPDLAPLAPDDPGATPGSGLPARALRMIDRIEAYLPDGGPDGLGWLQGTKRVDPNEWFFAAHFFQDPVCPGSLGIEALLQLLRFAALKRWPGTDRRIEPLCGIPHRWRYRGQVTPADKTMQVAAAICQRGDRRDPFVRADGVLSVDGRRIYHLENFGLRLAAAPAKRP
jgi:3-hydroxymyristoyl/3-hydroxydecanoyl-(acyl carrier protein) dehydratase